VKSPFPAKRRNLSASIFESLESRQHMSVSPYILSGTIGNDVISVNYGAVPILTTARTLTTSPTVPPTTTTTTTTVARTLTTKVVTSIFDQLSVTVNGVTTYPVLAAGQALQVNSLAGNDRVTVTGSRGVIINGGAGDDTITGGGGNDTINGEAGNDTIDGGLGNDTVSGGMNVDTIDYSWRSAGVTVKIDGYANDGQSGEADNILTDVEIVKGGWGNDNLWGNSADTVFRTFFGHWGNDTIVGGGGNDTIRGGAGDDMSIGNGGNDIIFADSGLDSMYGGDGNDRIYGGTGADFIRGGNGDDTIVTIGGGQSDVIYGDAGTDSFWVDAESTERITDATAAELKTNTHRVARYETLKIRGTVVGTPSREMNIGNLPDPDSTVSGATRVYRNFSNVPLFKNDAPVVTDVNQGGVGDCYFMAPLAAIVKRSPNVIRQSVVDLGDGTYAVKMRRDGVAKYIRVDADLPTDPGPTLSYAHWRSGTGALWAPILEKAWAWFRNSTGTYAGTANGFARETYKTLGVSYGQYDPYSWFNDSAQEFGNKLFNMLAGNQSVTLCTGSNGKYLESLHCYSVERVNKLNGQVTTIVLRNPWGTDGKGTDGVEDGFITMAASKVLASCNLIVHGSPQ